MPRRLSEILADPVALASAKRRACGDLGIRLGPPVTMRTPENGFKKRPDQPAQRRNVEPAAKARTQDATDGTADRPLGWLGKEE